MTLMPIIMRTFSIKCWRQVGECNFFIKSGESSPLSGNENVTKGECLRIAIGDVGHS